VYHHPRGHFFIQREIAGVVEGYDWRLESGKSSNAHPSTIRKLAKALGVDPTELLIGE
jgi:transcriptional regulator with XRE-family HTH domain